MKNRIWFLIFVFKTLLITAQSGGKISGEVVDEKGNPVGAADIIIDDGTYGTTSDVDGKYEIDQIDSGKYYIKVNLIGFETQEETVSIKSDEEKTVDFTLEETAQQMGEVLLQGKSQAAKIDETSFNVKAVRAQAFQNSTVDAAGILNRQSGVRVRQEGGLGSDYTFSLNGFTGNQVKFFIDGIPMDNYGESYNLSNIPANSIDHIEVYNGVVPINLGGDALGGAVNILTNQSNNYFDASYTIGSFNTHRASINGAYTNAKTGFTVRGDLNFDYSDNDYDVKVDVANDPAGQDTETRRVPRFHDRYKNARARVEMGFVNKDFADQLLVGAIVSGNDQQVQNATTMDKVYGAVKKEDQSFITTLKYAKDDLFTENLDVKFNGSYSYSDNKNIDTLQTATYNWAGKRFEKSPDGLGEIGGDIFYETNHDNSVNTQLDVGYQLNSKHGLALNHSFEYFDRSTFDRENPEKIINQFPKSSYKNILGLSYKYDFNEDWSTTLFGKGYFLKNKGSQLGGVANDENSREELETTSDNYSYGLASSYFIIPNLQVKASYEHTYRLPTPLELFGDGLFTDSNFDLKPEQSDNFNFNADYHFTLNDAHRIDIGSSFIYRNSDDLIYEVVTSSTPESSFQNIAKTRTLGVEGHFNYNYKNRLEIGGNITHQDITDQSDFVYDRDGNPSRTNFNKGARIPNKPFLFANGNASYRFANVFWDETELKLGYELHFAQEYYLSWERMGYRDSKNIIPQQTSHDFELVYSLKDGKYNVAFEMRNLFNEDLYDKYYLQKPGRAFYLKLRYTF